MAQETKGLDRAHRNLSISVSGIGDIHYCGKLLDLKRKFKEPKTEKRDLGIKAHKMLFEKDKWLLEKEMKKYPDLQDARNSGSVCIREFYLEGKRGDVIIYGSPDRVSFENGKPIHLSEYEFRSTERKVRTPPYPNEHVKVLTYGWLLNANGFDTSELDYSFVISSIGCAGCETLQDPFQNLLKVSEENEYCSCKPENRSRLWLYHFELERAEKEIDHVLKYVLGEEETVPTQNPYKCKGCWCREVCEYNLFHT